MSLENIKGHEFKKGVSGNPAGRPKSRIPDLLKACIGKNRAETVRDLNWLEIDHIEMAVLSLGNKDLQAIIKNDNSPMYLKGLALAALHDAKNGKTKTIDLLRDRQFGAVKKQVDLTTNGESMAQRTMTPEEAKKMLKQIEENF